jgi:cytochrome c5
MRPVMIAVIVALSVFAGSAMATDLTARDFTYLKAHWGLGRDSPVARAMSPAQRARLHDLINDPGFKGYPLTIEHNVADYLFQIETCFDWVASHSAAEPCPVAAALPRSPGRTVADQYCNACHLTGTANAPSFFQLAKEGGWTEQRLAAAIAHGHRMSPISLSPAELQALAAYIVSLRQ